MSTLCSLISLHIITIPLLLNADKLKCNDHGSFRIVQFTDTHFGESYIGDYLTLSMMNNILDEEKPDLVVLSGDIISGYTWNGKAGWFESLWDYIVEPIITRNISWIYTHGNHDAEGQFESNRTGIFKFIMHKYSNLGSLTDLGFVDKKVTKTFIPSIFMIENGDNTITKIYMIDSGELDCNGDYDYFGCLQMSQIEWYLKQDHTIPGIIYMHIPSKELMTFHNNKQYATIGSWHESNLNCFDERHIKINGNDKSFIDYVLQNDDIIAVFHGHEHIFDSLILYENDLCIGFGRKSVKDG